MDVIGNDERGTLGIITAADRFKLCLGTLFAVEFTGGVHGEWGSAPLMI